MAKSHCKGLLSNYERITTTLIRREAQRGGVKCVFELIKEETRNVLNRF